ncbi:FRG domain-containing protein [Photobacterium phosphoreum]|uniref:FRG domain-containing protein n=1 Tax=Photobacterium phosphoreum TaxID=659 RepID=UPI0039AFD944
MTYSSALEVIEFFAEQQKRDHINWLKLGLVSNLKEDEFFAIDVGNGSYRLAPYPESSTRLFRGQNTDYGICLPSLYRGNTELVNRILNVAKIHELKQSLQTLDGYNGKSQILGLDFSVDYEALSQHYGLASRYIDFSSNPLVAGFFAVTKYDAERSEYSLVEPQGTGIFYEINMAIEIARSNDIDIIGLQPFHRPAQQYAYGIKCSKKGLKHKYLVTEYKFFHGNQSYKIFDFTDSGKKLFPEDPVLSIVNKVKNTNYLSLSSVKWAMESIQVRNLKKQLKLLEKLDVNVGMDLPDYVTSEEKTKVASSWKEQKIYFNSKVKIRPVANHLELS